MPRIFDNIESSLLPALKETLAVSERADFCVGYFNLRGWKHLAEHVDQWAGNEGSCCRLLIGMHIAPSDVLRKAMQFGEEDNDLDHETAIQEKRKIAQEFRKQLTLGVPTNADESSLRKLANQILKKKLLVKVYLQHPLHAKLYLLHRKDPVNPIVGYLGSSNLTLAGLSHQGELNIDVLDSDAAKKLSIWFEDRWENRWCIDISDELAAIINESWAGDHLVPPYHVYLKMAHHLAQEARSGLTEFRIPSIFGDDLFDFQSAAVRIAAHHLHKRGGVLIGDVVGLGKSMMASALARIFLEDFRASPLIICPKNLVSMWNGYVHKYQLSAKVLSLSKVLNELPDKTPRYQVVLIDESHNLRNKEGKRWRAIREYIERNESFCILLSATPYNKTYRDLSAQLGLFLREDQELSIRPEKYISELNGEQEFVRRHQCSTRSLAAFEKSENPDDWRDLMRLYMVRRTRSFIMQHYAQEDEKGKYLQFSDGRKSYFPKREPKTIKFTFDENNNSDPYAQLYSDEVVEAINSLSLPRYGLKNYLTDSLQLELAEHHTQIIDGLSRAGTRLMGFCRTNLFKRLESTGPAFLLSIRRHILRNMVVVHAIENALDIPIGPQEAELLDTRYCDEDRHDFDLTHQGEENGLPKKEDDVVAQIDSEIDYRSRAEEIYKTYKSSAFRKRFKWLPSALFEESLKQDLLADATRLIDVLSAYGSWEPDKDAKLLDLVRLIQVDHSKEKILVFTQFSDTAHYLEQQLDVQGVRKVGLATGDSADPTELAWRFSPESSGGHQGKVEASEEIRVLISTDVLSEGQNLQDCAIIVNYDLPWAIIRLIQRAGRVDRIGQKSDKILCYSFLPADGLDRIIRLRGRVRKRLQESAEVMGSDEAFFGTAEERRVILDLYHEKSGILDDEGDAEVDLASYAYQIWKNALDGDPSLASKVEALPNVVYTTKKRKPDPKGDRGVLVYTRTSQGNDALAWINESGESVTQSQLTILKAAACSADTKALPRTEEHHALTKRGLEQIAKEEQSFGGALGRPSSPRARAYERIKRYRNSLGNRDLLVTEEHIDRIDQVLEDIYLYPLRSTAADALNRHIKTDIDDHKLVELALSLREEDRLCKVDKEEDQRAPTLICSMGLV